MNNYDFPLQSIWLVFSKNRLLLIPDGAGSFLLPEYSTVAALGLDLSRSKNLGSINGKPHYTLEVFQELVLPDDLKFISMMRLFSDRHNSLFKLAGRAVQIVDWDRTHRFCGHCGTTTEEKSGEFAKVCPKCGLSAYPRISPSIIVAVIKDRSLLLARSTHFANYKFHSVISGFVEPGESLEECIQREVNEEVGITVKNIRYFGSQPWPFPNSLMLAFTAEHNQGEITVDGEELYEADWYPVERLPAMPESDSIARRMIDWFIENNS